MANEMTTAKGIEALTSRIVSSIDQMLVDTPVTTLPKGYDPTAEIRSAMLYVANNVKDRNGKSALEVCTPGSIALALRSMVLQGLSIARKQTFPIVYGNKLILQNSLDGDMNVFFRIFPNWKIVPRAIFEGDTFDIEVLDDGSSRIRNFKTSFENKNKKIVGAFCNIIDTTTKEVVDCDYITWKQIEVAWSKAKTHNVQNDFPEEMAKRTVARRVMKRYINASIMSGASSTLAGVYDQSIADENVDINEMKNVTPAKTFSSKEKSNGAEGLASLLSDEPTEAVVEEAKPEPEPVAAAENVSNVPEDGIVMDESMYMDDDMVDEDLMNAPF
jgi:Recombinational DNA repair protein (RecE pathway)